MDLPGILHRGMDIEKFFDCILSRSYPPKKHYSLRFILWSRDFVLSCFCLKFSSVFLVCFGSLSATTGEESAREKKKDRCKDHPGVFIERL
jgi:hypothetical protein